MHYQFLIWYFHTLPVLLAALGLPWPIQALAVLGLEIAWNCHPSEAWSAAVVSLWHVAVLVALITSRHASAWLERKNESVVRGARAYPIGNANSGSLRPAREYE